VTVIYFLMPGVGFDATAQLNVTVGLVVPSPDFLPLPLNAARGLRGCSSNTSQCIGDEKLCQ